MWPTTSISRPRVKIGAEALQLLVLWRQTAAMTITVNAAATLDTAPPFPDKAFPVFRFSTGADRPDGMPSKFRIRHLIDVPTPEVENEDGQEQLPGLAAVFGQPLLRADAAQINHWSQSGRPRRRHGYRFAGPALTRRHQALRPDLI